MTDLREAAQQALEAHANRYQVVRDGYWWRVKIGNGTQTVGQHHTETGALRLASELHRAFHDGGFVVQEALKAALEQPEQEPVAWLYPEGLEALQKGKCWTVYGTKQDAQCSIPVYLNGAVAPKVEPAQAECAGFDSQPAPHQKLPEQEPVPKSTWQKLYEAAIDQRNEAVALNQELLEALKYHQEQTRPIERTCAAIAKAEGQA